MAAFLTVLAVGLAAHLPVMINDWPNHDGLSSMYFDQNMITSGRWFLSVACGFSSYFTIPWVIGLLSLLFLGVGAAALVEFLQIRETIWAVLISALLVSFPALCSTYAYLFTADGYMLALTLVFFAVLLTDRFPRGYLPGGLCLAFSMGIYQAYLPFAILLSLYGCLMVLMSSQERRVKLFRMLRYLIMGVSGAAEYYVILRILLLAEGKQLDTYQGINGMAGGQGRNVKEILASIYHDFIAFTGKGNVLYNNIFSLAAVCLLAAAVVLVCIRNGYVKNWKSYLTALVLAVLAPAATNVILVISPNVTYHLLMRYQWILYPILMIAFVLHSCGNGQKLRTGSGRLTATLQWMLLAAGLVLVLNYTVTDNIGYANLEKKYEKTYAYCLRLADRMEQTPGYYTGIPVAMIGVQSQKNYPETDITGAVTSDMIGMTGDYLVYTDNNYQAFMKHYLGITMNLVSDQKMEEIYRTKSYQSLDSFPGTNSMKVVDGILYIKTE